jgi:hypothetical protein
VTEGTDPPVLRIGLPGVVSWSRLRRVRDGVRYPAAYARARDAWSLLVGQAVRAARWRPPPIVRHRVEVTVRGGGMRDVDRVCTVVLDALQGGKAIRDDVFVSSLTATKTPAAAGERARTLLGRSGILTGPTRCARAEFVAIDRASYDGIIAGGAGAARPGRPDRRCAASRLRRPAPGARGRTPRRSPGSAG